MSAHPAKDRIGKLLLFFHIQALTKAKDVPNQDAHSARRRILIEIRVAKRQMSKI
jgi:hypothetical protein